MDFSMSTAEFSRKRKSSYNISNKDIITVNVDTESDTHAFLKTIKNEIESIFKQVKTELAINFNVICKSNRQIITPVSSYKVLRYVANDYTSVPQLLLDTTANLILKSFDIDTDFTPDVKDFQVIDIDADHSNIKEQYRKYLDDDLTKMGLKQLLKEKTIDVETINSIFEYVSKILSMIRTYSVQLHFNKNVFWSSINFDRSGCLCPDLYAPQPLTLNPFDPHARKHENFSNLLYGYTIFQSPIATHNNVLITSPYLNHSISGEQLPLIYVENIHNDVETFDCNSLSGTNGVFKSYKKVQYSTYNVMDNYDVLKMFDIKAGSVITIDKLFAAFYFILEQWSRNLKHIDIQYEICHYNCHMNLTENLLTEENFAQLSSIFVGQTSYIPSESITASTTTTIGDFNSAGFVRYVLDNTLLLNNEYISNTTMYLSDYATIDWSTSGYKFNRPLTAINLLSTNLSDIISTDITYTFTVAVSGDDSTSAEYSTTSAILDTVFPVNFPYQKDSETDQYKLKTSYSISVVPYYNKTYFVPVDTLSNLGIITSENALRDLSTKYDLAQKLFIVDAFKKRTDGQYEYKDSLTALARALSTASQPMDLTSLLSIYNNVFDTEKTEVFNVPPKQLDFYHSQENQIQVTLSGNYRSEEPNDPDVYTLPMGNLICKPTSCQLMFSFENTAKLKSGRYLESLGYNGLSKIDKAISSLLSTNLAFTIEGLKSTIYLGNDPDILTCSEAYYNPTSSIADLTCTVNISGEQYLGQPDIDISVGLKYDDNILHEEYSYHEFKNSVYSERPLTYDGWFKAQSLSTKIGNYSSLPSMLRLSPDVSKILSSLSLQLNVPMSVAEGLTGESTSADSLTALSTAFEQMLSSTQLSIISANSNIAVNPLSDFCYEYGIDYYFEFSDSLMSNLTTFIVENLSTEGPFVLTTNSTNGRIDISATSTRQNLLTSSYHLYASQLSIVIQ